MSIQIDLHCKDFIEHPIDKNSIDLVVTSPPYDQARDYKGYSFDYKLFGKKLFSVLKEGGILVWVVGEQTKNFCESLTPFRQCLFFTDDLGFNCLDTMIYHKNGGPPAFPGLLRYTPKFEYMFIFTKGKPKTFNPIKDKPNKEQGKISHGGQRQKDGSIKSFTNPHYIIPPFCIRDNVWKYDVGYMKSAKDKIAYQHPAIMPDKLAEDCILSWSNEGDIVLDPMMGSGTVGKMAVKNNRNFIGTEISSEYFEIAKTRIYGDNRLENFTE